MILVGSVILLSRSLAQYPLVQLGLWQPPPNLSQRQLPHQSSQFLKYLHQHLNQLQVQRLKLCQDHPIFRWLNIRWSNIAIWPYCISWVGANWAGNNMVNRNTVLCGKGFRQKRDQKVKRLMYTLGLKFKFQAISSKQQAKMILCWVLYGWNVLSASKIHKQKRRMVY